jgi:transposase
VTDVLHGEEAAPGLGGGFRPEYCDKLVEVMRAGFSLTAFAGSMGVSRAVLERWATAHAGFRDALARAKAAGVLHWEEAALRVAAEGGGSGAATVIMFALKTIAPEEFGEPAEPERFGEDRDPMATADDLTLARAAALILSKGVKARSRAGDLGGDQQ